MVGYKNLDNGTERSGVELSKFLRKVFLNLSNKVSIACDIIKTRSTRLSSLPSC